MTSVSVSSQSRLEKITTPSFQLSTWTRKELSFPENHYEHDLFCCLGIVSAVVGWGLTGLGRYCFIYSILKMGGVGVVQNKNKENLCPENLGATHLHQGRYPSQAELTIAVWCREWPHPLYNRLVIPQASQLLLQHSEANNDYLKQK